MSIRIISWNTQGTARAKISSMYSNLLLPHGENILLLQEAGVPSSFGVRDDGGQFNWKLGRAEYKGSIYPQENADNQRCSVAVLHNSLNIIDLQYVQIAGIARPILILKYGRSLYIATCHAKAARRPALQEIAAIRDYMNSKFWEWILMGDFNIRRDDFVRAFGDNTIPAPGATHMSGNALDHALISNSLVGRGMSLNILNGGDSDHFPICIDLA